MTQAFARHFFGEESPLGHRFGMEGEESSREIEIVGLVPDLKYRDLKSAAPRLVFFPAAQDMEYLNALQVRTRTEPTAAAEQVRRAVLEVAPSLPILSIHPLTEDVERAVRQERLLSRLTTLFGLLALVLASIGLFGVLLYSVARRTNEIGIRMALGAPRSRVLGMVLRNALSSVGVGALVGVAGTLLAGRLLSSLLFGIDASDPGTIVIAIVTLGLVAAVAAIWPAWRAARLDPVKALRQE